MRKEPTLSRIGNLHIQADVPNTVEDNQTIQQCYNLIVSNIFNNVEKKCRQLFYPTSGDMRYSKEHYDKWSGGQVFDIDIKNVEITQKLKLPLHEKLKKFRWYAFISLSTSHNGFHIYTGVDVNDVKDFKTTYCFNYLSKANHIWKTIQDTCNELNITLSNKNIKNEDVMDTHMLNVSQGVFIGDDPDALWNEHWFPLPFDMNDRPQDVLNIEQKVMSFFVEKPDIIVDNSGDIPSDFKGPRHYKYADRYAIINTLVSLYGDEATKSMLDNIFVGTKRDELLSCCRTARNKKPDERGISLLNENHGFNIKYDKKDEVAETLEKKDSRDNVIDLKQNEYLSDYIETIYEIIGDSSFIVLESGTGTGKTEFSKSLNGKTIVIEPYTSVVEGKFDDSWEKCYGSHKPQYQTNMVMTPDKFAYTVNPDKLYNNDFKYIVLDESHLLFNEANYRKSMIDTIKQLKTLVAMNKSLVDGIKIIIMTGTPFGERLFFNDMYECVNIKYDKYIKVNKATFDKTITIYGCKTKAEMITVSVVEIVKQIHANGVALNPCNLGVLYTNTITRLIDYIGYQMFDDWKPIKALTIRRSTSDSEDVQYVLTQYDIEEYDFISLTTFLSCGNDIHRFKKDRTPLVVFNNIDNDIFNANDIEQYSNRLRRTDINTILCVNVDTDTDGNIIPPTNNGIRLTSFKSNMDFYKGIANVGNYCYNKPGSFEGKRFSKRRHIIVNEDINDTNYCIRYGVDDISIATLSFYTDMLRYVSNPNIIKKHLTYYGWSVGDIVRPTEDVLKYVSVVENMCREYMMDEIDIRRRQYEKYIEWLTSVNNRATVQAIIDKRVTITQDTKMDDSIFFNCKDELFVRDKDRFVSAMYQIQKLLSCGLSINEIKKIYNDEKNWTKNGTVSHSKIDKIISNIIANSKDNIATGIIQDYFDARVGREITNIDDVLKNIKEYFVYVFNSKDELLNERFSNTAEEFIKYVYDSLYTVDENNMLCKINYKETYTIQDDVISDEIENIINDWCDTNKRSDIGKQHNRTTHRYVVKNASDNVIFDGDYNSIDDLVEAYYNTHKDEKKVSRTMFMKIYKIEKC